MFAEADRIFETSTTVGAGTYTVDGAQVGFQAFSVLGAGNDCTYFATDDINWEVAIGTVLAGPNRVQRTTILASSNGGAAVNWAAGTRKIRSGIPAAGIVPKRRLSKNVAGGVDVALTTDEQRRDVLEFTGALTANISVTVDATVWNWIAYNNTTGNFTLTLKVTGLAGVELLKGRRTPVYCDATDVRSAATIPYSGAIAAGRNIAARTNAATPNTKLDISADELQLKDANGNLKVVTGVAVTIDFGAAVGANGPDAAGAQTASAWSYGWVICKDDGTVAGLGSASSAAPTMPAGYTYRALATSGRSAAGPAFVKYRQAGNTAYFEASQLVLSAGNASGETNISLSSVIPPNAESVIGYCWGQISTGGAAAGSFFNIRLVSLVDWLILKVQASNTQNPYNTSHFEAPNIGQNLYYLFNNDTGTAITARDGTVYITGFKLPLGGE